MIENQTLKANDGLECALYPLESIRITQTHYGSTSHSSYKVKNTGLWDVTGGASDETKGKIFAPFSLKVVQVYTGKSNGNTVLCVSTNKVHLANGKTDYVSFAFGHDNVVDVKKGQTYVQGEHIGDTGNYGNVTGVHSHFILGTGKSNSIPTTTNKEGKTIFYLKNAIDIDDLFFINGIKEIALVTGKDSVTENEDGTTTQITYCDDMKVTNTWKKYEGDEMDRLIKIVKDDNYDYKWSVDGNKYGENYDITVMGGFADNDLKAQGYEQVLKVNGSLFYTYENKSYACGLEKTFGDNHQDSAMSCVSTYDNAMAIAGVGGDLWYASQKWIINNKLNEAYCAITGLGLVLGGKAKDMHAGFNTQWNQISGRTIIGEDKDGNILSYSIAGTTGKSGLTGKQAQAKALELGFYNAIMLDGGGSVFRVYNGVTDISTTRKVKNALMLYRKKKTSGTTPNDTTDYKSKYEEEVKLYKELDNKYISLSTSYETLKSNYNVLETKYNNLNNTYTNVTKENTELSNKISKIKEVING